MIDLVEETPWRWRIDPTGGMRVLGIVFYDVSHNLAKLEDHEVGGRRKLLCVHRKGAANRAHVPWLVGSRLCRLQGGGDRVKDRDIEFIPTDELVEEEAEDPEDEAAHAEDVEQPAGLEATQAEDVAAEELEGAEADELAAEAVEAPIDVEALEAEEEEHEEDLGEILRRHFGIEEEEEQDEFALGEGELRAGRPKEFLCRACFLLKPTSQLADAAQGICRDCAANRA